jgi:PAS domain S-box-containing protein
MIPLPVLIAALAGTYRAQQRAHDARAWVEHTQDVRDCIQEMVIRLLDAEAFARDFLATGEPPARERFRESKELLPPLTQRLAVLVHDDPPQLRRAGEVRELIQGEVDALSALCDHRSDTTVPAEIARFTAPESGRGALNRVRAKIAAMQLEEERLLHARSHGEESARFRLFKVLIESTIMCLFFQMAAALLLTGTLSRQIRALDKSTRLLRQGLPAEPVDSDNREIHDLAMELRHAAGLLGKHEQERRQSEERFRMLFNEAPVAYHEIDREGVVRDVNSAECALIGRSPDEVIGKQVWELVSRESRDVVRRNILDRLAQVRPSTPYECDFECPDQSLVTVEIHENLIRDKRGQVTGIRSALLDVTARRLVHVAVKKVEQYAQELRTKNEQLLLALGAAREASATKGRFLAAMSHELRTPLNGIIGLTELMFDGVVGPVSDEHKEYLEDILASSRYLLQLVNDVLDLAKVESGKMQFRTESVEVGPLICEVRDVLRILAEKKKISLSVDTGELATVMTDAARLKQVVYNYLSNAIKFTIEGGAIQVRARLEGARNFRIEVEDNGPGIQDTDIPRLFADFQQLDSTRPGLGTGLGLALTKRIVEGQGGSVGLRSKPGIGSVFFAVLPVEPAAERTTSHPGTGVGFDAVADSKIEIAVFPVPMRGQPRSLQEALRP